MLRIIHARVSAKNKYHMRYHDLIEAPITDFQILDQTDKPVASFDDRDTKLLRTNRVPYRFIKAFEKTPHNFQVMIVRNSNQRHDGDITDTLGVIDAGIHDHYDHFGLDVRGESGTIRVILLGNISPTDKIPITPWILAHKIGHSFQDVGSTVDYPNISNIVKRIDTLTGNTSPYEMFEPHPRILDQMTVRSARSGRLVVSEVFPELVAQYLITGRVTLRDSDWG